MQELELIHQSFRILNKSEFIYDWDRNIEHTAKELNIDKDKLESILVECDLYKWDKEIKQYILK